MRRGWRRSCARDGIGLCMSSRSTSHRARALLGARAQLVGMTTRLSNHIRGVLKTFGLLPGAMRGLPFDRRVEALLADRDDVAPIVRPMLAAWRQLREQIAAFDKAVRVLAKSSPTCRHLMSVPGIGVAVRARLCQHGRGSGALRPITIRRRAPRADAEAISVGRDRPQRQDIEVRRHARPHADVRGGGGDHDAGQAGFRPEGLGTGDCKAIGCRQGARGAGAESSP